MSLRIFDEKLEEECINIGTKYLKLYLNLNKVTTNLTNQLVKYIKKQYLRGTQRKISDGEIEEIIRSLQKGVKVRDKNKIRRKMHNLVARAIQRLDYRLAKNGLIQPKEIRFSASCTKDIRLKWFKLRFNGCELPDSLKALQAPEMNNGSDEEHHVSPNQGSSTPPDESEDHPAEEPSNQVSSTPIEESEAEHHVISPNQVSSTPAVVSSKRRAQQPEKRATPHDHTRSVSSVPSNKRTSSDAGFNTHNSNRVLRRKRMKIGGKTASCNNAVESFFAPTATGRTGSWVCKVGTSFDEASLPLKIARYIETDADIHFSYVTEPSTSAFANAWSKLHELINEFKSAESDLHVVCIQAGKDSPITYFMEQFCITDEVIEWYVEHMKSTRKKRIHNQEGFDTFGGKHKRNTPGRYYVRDAFQPDIMKEFEDKDMLSDNKIQNFIAFETYVRNAIQIMFARHGYHLNLEQVLTDRSSPRSELATQYSLDLLWSEPRLVTQGKVRFIFSLYIKSNVISNQMLSLIHVNCCKQLCDRQTSIQTGLRIAPELPG